MQTTWRVTSDYVGAGRFLIYPDRIIVGTDYGVQCVPRNEKSGVKGWEARLDTRCVGLHVGEGGDTVAGCVKGLFVLSENGEQRWGTHSFKEIVGAPVAFRDGFLLTTRSSIHYVREWNGSEWRFDFAEVLGSSVKGIRLVNLFELDGQIVVGAVDYDSGIGRVVVLDGASGTQSWMSDPGPVSELFAAGKAVFVWCLTGYGKFETHMTRIDGHEIWTKDFAGVGVVRPDGALAMLVGSNESPAWDDWEYRQVSPTGREEKTVMGKGRCALRPVCDKDGTVYFVGSVLPVDVAGSRMDYTSFFAMPQEVVFQHLMGIRPSLPEYEVCLHRLRNDSEFPEVIYEVNGSFAFARLQLLGDEVVLCDGQDIVGVKA
jgi:hypothetical protein